MNRNTMSLIAICQKDEVIERLSDSPYKIKHAILGGSYKGLLSLKAGQHQRVISNVVGNIDWVSTRKRIAGSKGHWWVNWRFVRDRISDIYVADGLRLVPELMREANSNYPHLSFPQYVLAHLDRLAQQNRDVIDTYFGGDAYQYKLFELRRYYVVHPNPMLSPYTYDYTDVPALSMSYDDYYQLNYNRAVSDAVIDCSGNWYDATTTDDYNQTFSDIFSNTSSDKPFCIVEFEAE